jgi:hypothetical protein
MIKYLFLLFIFSILSACYGNGAKITGTLSVHTDNYWVIDAATVTFKENDTVLDILKKATRDARIHMEYTGAGLTSYVKGIDNIYEFDKGPESGWIYSVNGEEIQQSAGTYKPADGDIIIWTYITAR